MIFKIRSSILLTMLALTGCHSAEKKREEHRIQEMAKAARDSEELRAQYDAVADWPQKLSNNMFSIDIEPIFLRTDHRPELFYGILDDIRRNNGSVLLYFTTIPTADEPSLRLILDCGGCDLNAFKKYSDTWGDFVVIADVTEASKAIDESENAPEYTVTGRLIDARFVGDYAPSKRSSEHP